MTAESWSTCTVTAVLKPPALIHGKSWPTYVSPWSTRAKTKHETTKDRPSAGTAIQCAKRPVSRPKSALASAPTSGKSGINQTSRDIVLLGTNPQHSIGRPRGCQGHGRAAAGSGPLRSVDPPKEDERHEEKEDEVARG